MYLPESVNFTFSFEFLALYSPETVDFSDGELSGVFMNRSERLYYHQQFFSKPQDFKKCY
jgi:hypothetical protein